MVNPKVRLLSFLLFLLLIFINQNAGLAQNELNVLKGNWLEYGDAPDALYHYLSRQAYYFLEERSRKISAVNTLDSWQKRQNEIRKILMEIVGPFPEKTPLNPMVTRTIEKSKYKVEHIVFESQPGFFVTSSLYIPAGLKRNARVPAVIYCSGHSADGYRSPVYQHVIINLVYKGFVVFAFDPVGQGERLEYPDRLTGKSLAGGPTKEHSYPGAQAFIAGSSQAMYMIWDGIRAVDYLLTRKEVDPSKIGITGRSGGGTQSACIAAFDERIYAAAPENYITSYKRLLQTIGPQDAEQNLFNILARGLDHADFLVVRAPRPAMMITTTRDMFSIQGAIETENEVKRIYKAYGQEKNFSRAEDDAGHESTRKNREYLYAFFQEHFGNPGNPSDENIELLTADELRVTETGLIATSLLSETVFSLNKKRATELQNKLMNSRGDPVKFLPEVISSARELSGFREPEDPGEPVFAGRIVRDGYKIEKYFIKGEGDYVVPYLLFLPDSGENNVVIYLHPESKSAEALPGGEIEQMVRRGIKVLSPDLPGRGELGQGSLRGDADFGGVSHNLWYSSMLIGRSIAGIEAGDIIRLVRVVRRSYPGVIISSLSKGSSAPALLHAAVFSPEIDRVILIAPYTSYFSVVETRLYDPALIFSTIPGVLKAYDLPDIASALAPRKLFIAGPTDGRSSLDDNKGITRDLDVIKAVYSLKDADGQLLITRDVSFERIIGFMEN